MDTDQDRPQHGQSADSGENNATFDYAMFALAAVLLLTVTAAASILIMLPQTLDAVAAPALGAPWMTAAPQAPPTQSKRQPCQN